MGECAWSPGGDVLLKLYKGKWGNEWEMGNVLYIFIQVNFIFKGENSGEMGDVLESIYFYYWPT